MNTYEFTLRFALSDPAVSVEERLERLAAAGCDDALPGIGHAGSIALAFTRSAASARRAVLGAVSDATRAMPGARPVEASPDLVGLTDVAALMGFSRQNMRQLMRGGGPVAAHDGKPALWHLADILEWLADVRGYAVSPALRELAEVTRQLNLGMGAEQIDAGFQRALRTAVAG